MLGQAPPTCVTVWPTNTTDEEARRRLAAMPDWQRQAALAPHVLALQQASTPADAVQPEAERRAVAQLAEQVLRERAVLKMCSAVARDAVDSVASQAGIQPWVPGSWTRERLFLARDAATSRGVPAESAIALVRADIYARLQGQADPWPQGDLDDLASRLAAIAQRQAPAQFQQPVQPLPQVEPAAAQPAGRRRGGHGQPDPGRGRRGRGRGPSTTTLALGALALLGLGLALRR